MINDDIVILRIHGTRLRFRKIDTLSFYLTNQFLTKVLLKFMGHCNFGPMSKITIALKSKLVSKLRIGISTKS